MKIHYGQESPHDQLHTQIGAIRGEVQNIIDGVARDPTDNAKHILFLLEAMQGVLAHVKDVKWDPTIPLECDIGDPEM